jgi:hypothetical protein
MKPNNLRFNLTITRNHHCDHPTQNESLSLIEDLSKALINNLLANQLEATELGPYHETKNN